MIRRWVLPFSLVLVFVVGMLHAITIDQCSRYGRLGGFETRYEPVLLVLPGSCWARFNDGGPTYNPIEWYGGDR